MPQAMNLSHELVSFFRQSRRRSWTKNQIIEVIHQAYIKQLEKAVEIPRFPPISKETEEFISKMLPPTEPGTIRICPDEEVDSTVPEVPKPALSCKHCEKPIYRITGGGSPAFFHVETKEHYCEAGGTAFAEPPEEAPPGLEEAKPTRVVNSTTFTCKHCEKPIYSTAQGEPFPFLHILNDEYWCGENKTTNAEPLEETPKG